MTKKTTFKLAFTALVFFFAMNLINAQEFPAAVGEYASGAAVTATKVTINKPAPFWVYPDVIYNQDWEVPVLDVAVGYIPMADIIADIASSFVWTTPGDPVRSNESFNYVELQWAATGTHEISVLETAPAPFSCSGTAQILSVQVIDVPYARLDVSVETLMGLDNVLASGCETVTTTINAVFGNADEDYPYNINFGYTVYNPTFDGSGEIVLGTPIDDQSSSEGSPLVVSDTELVAETNFVLVNNKITVYQFELRGWNAQISRKSDYLDILNEAGKSLDTPGDYTYYNASNAGDVLTAYVVVLPQPATGPIYHIPDTFSVL